MTAIRNCSERPQGPLNSPHLHLHPTQASTVERALEKDLQVVEQTLEKDLQVVEQKAFTLFDRKR